MWKEISVERADTLTCHLLRDRKSFRWSVLTSAPFACVCKPRKEDLRTTRTFLRDKVHCGARNTMYGFLGSCLCDSVRPETHLREILLKRRSHLRRVAFPGILGTLVVPSSLSVAMYDKHPWWSRLTKLPAGPHPAHSNVTCFWSEEGNSHFKGCWQDGLSSAEPALCSVISV